MTDEPDPKFEPGPPREPIAHSDIDLEDVPAIVEYLERMGVALTPVKEPTDG